MLTSDVKQLSKKWKVEKAKNLDPLLPAPKIKDTHSKHCKPVNDNCNYANFTKQNLLFKDIDNLEYFYFCHSYYYDSQDKNNVITETNYSSNFARSINFLKKQPPDKFGCNSLCCVSTYSVA